MQTDVEGRQLFIEVGLPRRCFPTKRFGKQCDAHARSFGEQINMNTLFWRRRTTQGRLKADHYRPDGAALTRSCHLGYRNSSLSSKEDDVYLLMLSMNNLVDSFKAIDVVVVVVAAGEWTQVELEAKLLDIGISVYKKLHQINDEKRRWMWELIFASATTINGWIVQKEVRWIKISDTQRGLPRQD